MNTQLYSAIVMILLESYFIAVMSLLIIIPIKHTTIYTQNVYLWLITLEGTFENL